MGLLASKGNDAHLWGSFLLSEAPGVLKIFHFPKSKEKGREENEANAWPGCKGIAGHSPE